MSQDLIVMPSVSHTTPSGVRLQATQANSTYGELLLLKARSFLQLTNPDAHRHGTHRQHRVGRVKSTR